MSLKEFIYFNKGKLIVFIFLVLIGVVFFGYFYYERVYNDDKENKIDEVNVSLEKVEKVEDEKAEMCFFDIKGEVVKPGVYSIDCSKRLIDAINIAGGLTKNSDTSVLNLSKKIEDGLVFIVYSKKEVSAYLETLKETEKKQSICNNSNVENSGCIVDNSSNNTGKNNLININVASLSELMTLTGIGESKAKSIIEYRKKTPFKKIEDILNVEGIGESIYVNIKENITI